MADARRLLDLLWARYAADVPFARTFLHLSGGSLVDDHVAFRSLARPGGGIALFAPVFERLGWRRAGTYTFPDTHLAAIHLSHPSAPRVFLSELDPAPLSADSRRLLAALPPDPAPPSDIDALAAWFDAPAPFLTEAELLALEAESQYAAWLALFGRKVNHFTAAVDHIDTWPPRLLAAGVPMKPAIEGAPGSPLRQTATAAAPLPIRLADGATRPWPYAYLELAERAPGFDGFLAPQARHLFDQTRRS